MIFELVCDFADVLDAMPRDHPRYHGIDLLNKAIRHTAQMVARRPTTLFQCLWNSHRALVEATCSLSFQSAVSDCPRYDELFQLLVAYHSIKEQQTPRFPWIRRLVNPPAPPHDAIASIAAHGDAIGLLELSPNGEMLVTVGTSYDTSIRVWNLDTLSMRWESRTALRDYPTHFSTIRFSPNGRLMIAESNNGSLGNELALWELTSGHVVGRFCTRQNDLAKHLAVSISDHDGAINVTGTIADALSSSERLWIASVLEFSDPGLRTENGAFHSVPVFLREAKRDAQSSISQDWQSAMPSGFTLVTAALPELRLLAIAVGSQAYIYHPISHNAVANAYNDCLYAATQQNKGQLYASNRRGAFWIYQHAHRRFYCIASDLGDPIEIGVTETPLLFAVSDDHSLIAAVIQNRLTLMSVSSRTILSETILDHPEQVKDVQFFSRDEYIAVRNGGASIHVFDSRGSLARHRTIDLSDVLQIAYSPTCPQVALLRRDRLIVWDLVHSREVASKDCPNIAEKEIIQFSPDGTKLVHLVHLPYGISIFEIESGQILLSSSLSPTDWNSVDMAWSDADLVVLLRYSEFLFIDSVSATLSTKSYSARRLSGWMAGTTGALPPVIAECSSFNTTETRFFRRDNDPSSDVGWHVPGGLLRSHNISGRFLFADISGHTVLDYLCIEGDCTCLTSKHMPVFPSAGFREGIARSIEHRLPQLMRNTDCDETLHFDMLAVGSVNEESLDELVVRATRCYWREDDRQLDWVLAQLRRSLRFMRKHPRRADFLSFVCCLYGHRATDMGAGNNSTNERSKFFDEALRWYERQGRVCKFAKLDYRAADASANWLLTAFRRWTTPVDLAANASQQLTATYLDYRLRSSTHHLLRKEFEAWWSACEDATQDLPSPLLWEFAQRMGRFVLFPDELWKRAIAAQARWYIDNNLIGAFISMITSNSGKVGIDHWIEAIRTVFHGKAAAIADDDVYREKKCFDLYEAETVIALKLVNEVAIDSEQRSCAVRWLVQLHLIRAESKQRQGEWSEALSYVAEGESVLAELSEELRWPFVADLAWLRSKFTFQQIQRQNPSDDEIGRAIDELRHTRHLLHDKEMIYGLRSAREEISAYSMCAILRCALGIDLNHVNQDLDETGPLLELLWDFEQEEVSEWLRHLRQRMQHSPGPHGADQQRGEASATKYINQLISGLSPPWESDVYVMEEWENDGDMKSFRTHLAELVCLTRLPTLLALTVMFSGPWLPFAASEFALFSSPGIALVVSYPVWAVQLWRFCAPGLQGREHIGFLICAIVLPAFVLGLGALLGNLDREIADVVAWPVPNALGEIAARGCLASVGILCVVGVLFIRIRGAEKGLSAGVEPQRWTWNVWLKVACVGLVCILGPFPLGSVTIAFGLVSLLVVGFRRKLPESHRV